MKITRSDRIRTIKLGDIRVSPVAQRELRPARVKYILNSLDFDKIGTLEVSYRDGFYWLIDGQHRWNALIEFLGEGWKDHSIEAWCWTDLTEEQEARKFLERNDVLAVDAFAKFKVGVTAGDPIPCDINRIVLGHGLTISSSGNQPNSIKAVHALTRIYSKFGPDGLSKPLTLIQEGLGEMAFEASIIEGVALFFNRYQGRLDEGRTIKVLSTTPRGVKGIIQQAAVKKEQFGQPLVQCVAAVITDRYNKGLRNASLGSWWKEGDE